MAQEGAWIPLRIQVHGNSMFPLVRVNRDYVTIRPIEATGPALQRGDIVLFSDPVREERYVLHRVWQAAEDSILTWGDNCVRPDGWIPLSHGWGKAVLVERGQRRIELDPAKGIRMAECWHIAGKGWRAMQRVKQRAKSLIKKLIRRESPGE